MQAELAGVLATELRHPLEGRLSVVPVLASTRPSGAKSSSTDSTMPIRLHVCNDEGGRLRSLPDGTNFDLGRW